MDRTRDFVTAVLNPEGFNKLILGNEVTRDLANKVALWKFKQASA